MNSIRLDPSECLYKDNSLQTFSYLTPQDLAQCCQVSKKWQILASGDELWSLVIPGIRDIVKTNIKKYIDCHAIVSEEQLVDRVEKFVNKIPCDGNSKFTCTFPFNPEYKIHLDYTISGAYGSFKLPLIGRFNLKFGNYDEFEENYIFVKALQSDNNGQDSRRSLNTSSGGTIFPGQTNIGCRHFPDVNLPFFPGITIDLNRFFDAQIWYFQNNKIVLPPTFAAFDNTGLDAVETHASTILREQVMVERQEAVDLLFIGMCAAFGF